MQSYSQKFRQSNHPFTIQNIRCYSLEEPDVTSSHCGNYGVLLPRFFRKNSVKSTFLLKNSKLNDLTEKTVNFTFFHTVSCTLWKLRSFTATIFSQKFRQINVLLIDKERYCRLILRKKTCHSFFTKIPSNQRFA